MRLMGRWKNDPLAVFSFLIFFKFLWYNIVRKTRRDRIAGLVRALGERVYRKVSWVRIPLSPLYKKDTVNTVSFSLT